MFDSKYLTSDRQLTMKQLDKPCREGIHGVPNFLTWFREHVNPHLISYLSLICIIFNHLTYLIGSQCVLGGNVHADLRQNTEVLLPKVMVSMTSMCFCSVQPFLKLLAC
jgi:hypothetical protein